MRVAIFSDIHGNPIALEAVLADVQAQGVEAYWVLGDLAAIGYAPVAVLERLTQLENVTFVRGNTDRYLVTGERPPPHLEEAKRDPHLVRQVTEVAASFAWSQGYVTACGWIDWLAKLPLEQRWTLPDGTRLLAVHAAPGRDDGEGIHPGRSAAEMQALTQGCAADLLCVGHTHCSLDLQVGGVRVVNVGSVSNPLAPDLRASYVLLDAGLGGYTAEHRYVDYNHQAVIEVVRRSRHPAADFIVQYELGQRYPRW